MTLWWLNDQPASVNLSPLSWSFNAQYDCVETVPSRKSHYGGNTTNYSTKQMVGDAKYSC